MVFFAEIRNFFGSFFNFRCLVNLVRFCLDSTEPSVHKARLALEQFLFFIFSFDFGTLISILLRVFPYYLGLGPSAIVILLLSTVAISTYAQHWGI